MNATAETVTPIDEKTQRREARARLKDEVKKASTKPATSKRATVLYMLISHTRRKLHCHTYGLYAGGWRTVWAQKDTDKWKTRTGWAETERAKKYLARFGTALQNTARSDYQNALLYDLSDQRDFLEKFLKEDEKRAAKLPAWEKAGRTIYAWMKPRFDAELREICRKIIDQVEVS